MGQVAGDVLQGGVSDPRTPGEIQADQLPQVLGDQLDAVISDLAAARQGQNGQICPPVVFDCSYKELQQRLSRSVI